MIDYVKFEIKHDYIDIRSFNCIPTEYLGLTFNPLYNQINEVKTYIHKNSLGFALKLFSNKLYFEGSFHKLYNTIYRKKGNHTDFDYQQLQEIIKWLEHTLDCDASQMIIRNIEIGVNIKANHFTEFYFEKVKAYQVKKLFDPMRKGAKTYGKQCRTSQFKVKLYDKAFESAVHQGINTQSNLLRYELSYFKMQSLKKVITTVSDLKKPTVFNALGNVLKKRFRQIQFSNGVMDASGLKPNDRQLYYAGLSNTFWLDEKISNPQHYYLRLKHKKITEELKKETPNNFINLIAELESKIDLKIQELKK